MARTVYGRVAAYEDEVRALRDEIAALRDRAADTLLKGLDLQMEAVDLGERDRAFRATEGVRLAHTALALAVDVTIYV